MTVLVDIYQTVLLMYDNCLLQCFEGREDSKEEEFLWLQLRFNKNKNTSLLNAFANLNKDKKKTRYFVFSSNMSLVNTFS